MKTYKIYNLCNKEEYLLYKKNNPEIDVDRFEYFIGRFLYFYSNDLCYAHRLDGPAFEYKENNLKKFLINREYISEEDYWKLPDVLAFKYLKDHPELEAFI